MHLLMYWTRQETTCKACKSTATLNSWSHAFNNTKTHSQNGGKKGEKQMEMYAQLMWKFSVMQITISSPDTLMRHWFLAAIAPSLCSFGSVSSRNVIYVFIDLEAFTVCVLKKKFVESRSSGGNTALCWMTISGHVKQLQEEFHGQQTKSRSHQCIPALKTWWWYLSAP